jgi:hypothetical protein
MRVIIGDLVYQQPPPEYLARLLKAEPLDIVLPHGQILNAFFHVGGHFLPLGLCARL